MGITDELRKFIEDPLLGYAPQDQHIEMLTKIADRIDAVHEAAVSYWQSAHQLAQDEDVMAEHGWERMPEDADGEYWFCGDKIMLPDGNVVEIIGIGGDWLYYCVESVAMTVFGRIRAHDKRHYKQPTVEDVLLDMHRRLSEVSELYDVDSDELEDEYTCIIAEYAAKLRLADDKEDQ